MIPPPQPVSLKDGRVAVLRPATSADAEALIAFVDGVGAEGVYIMTEKMRYTVPEEREYLGKIDGHTAVFLVATLNGTLVGSMDITRGNETKNAHTASVGIAIRKDLRGLGLGKAMMEAGIRWARSVGIHKLTLGVFASNERALAFYRGLGFTEEGRLRGQVLLEGRPVDELLMALWL
jgi:hypothetical protein